ncbi:T9SS type A sorting domain-containing protein [Neolewinella litorea]|uniref:T9SS type A sorting domain-containing protein n=1 Tax=Neolewinella litorea TaxID=2562452 RepID=A0A4S4NIB6_9BACT|nr:T9SS type A sorting domain-containing protein [Neolewinella litorea]THH39439.1 T9SS type A sorting domain-containing protein [Neolewinella litorea]
MRSHLLSLLFLLVTGLSAQDCFYQLQLTDQGGDGWNGAVVTVTVDGRPRVFTLDAMNDDGARRDFFFPVENGDRVTVGFTAGAFPGEVGLSILDNNDSLIYTVSAPATLPELTAFTAQCRTCAPPPLSSIELYRLRYNSVDLRFRGSPDRPTYRITYGEAGFDPDAGEGTRITTQDTMLRIEDLQTRTAYEFYVATECDDPEQTSVRRGPFRIVTPIRRDVGITVLRSPVDRCQRDGTDTLTVGVTNFGGEPQQFFRINFTVNGEAGGVNFPFDGIYTGVVGVDSTEFFSFKTPVDLRDAGYYEIKVYTQLEGDENTENDTLTASVVSLPVIADFPYLESFETGNGFWLPEAAGRGPSSWDRARPAAPRINRAGSGDFAFVTNAGGPYNDDELSYLKSPCFDFSGFTDDPFMSFLLYVDTEAQFDGLYLQATTDGGATWRRVESNPTSVNWYNNRRQQVWDGDGGFGGGYALVGQQLRGLAGRKEVRFRFVFVSDGDGQREGVAIDNIRIARRPAVDYAAVSARLLNGVNCEERTDTLAFTFTQLGREPVDSLTVSYALNGGDTVSARAAAPRVIGQPMTYRFADPLTVNQETGTENRLMVWLSAENDGALYNDTLTYVYPVVQEIPFLVDFEDGRIPDNWSLPADAVIARRAGTPSVALTDNLNEQDADFSFTTASYGVLEADDELTFTLRLRDADGDPVSGVLESLAVAVGSDCDDVVSTLLFLEDVPADSTFTLPLSAVGQGFFFTFTAVRAEGDFFVTFDDIGVRRCPGSLDLRYTTAPPSGIFADDGTAYVLVGAGLPPYTYAWSNGDTSQSADSLSVADYTVTVTDAVGCTDQLSVSVDLDAVATEDPNAVLAGLEVFPNPTSGWLSLRLELPTAEQILVEVYDARGQRLQVQDLGRRAQVAGRVDLSQVPSGMYFLRVRAGEAARTLRIARW